MTRDTPYDVRFALSAQRDLARIPPRYAAAVIEFVTNLLPTNPNRLGKPLFRLEGLHGARRGDYRVLYTILQDDYAVLVIRVDHRARAYAPAADTGRVVTPEGNAR